MLPADLPPPPVDAVEVSLVAYATAACGAAAVDVQWVGLPAVHGDELVWEGDPCRSRPYLRLVVLQGGVPAARYSVRPSLVIQVAVPVASEAADPGQVVRTVPGLAALSDVRGAPVSEGTWVARTRIEAGEPVTALLVTTPVDVRRGDAVDLVVERGSVRITAPGHVLQDARIGESVRVINEATRTALDGTLVGPATVAVQ